MKTCIMLVPIVLSSVNVIAQEFYGGIYGGWLKNEMKITDDSPLQSFGDHKKLNTVNFGIHAGYKLTDHWGIEAQFQYNNIAYRKELQMANPDPGGTMFKTIYWDNHYRYLRIPLLAHYQLFSPASRFGLGILAGPSFGSLIQQRSTFTNADGSDPTVENKPTITGVAFKKMDLGIQFGLRGQALLNKSINIFLEGMIYQGFSNAVDLKNSANLYNDLTVVNRYGNLNLGIQYNFSGNK